MTSLCPTCCTRFDACSECHAEEIAKRDAEIARLKRACEVLFYGSPELHQVAENAYSGCPSTERDNPHELKKALETGK